MVCVLPAHSQTRPARPQSVNEFLGIKFGSSKDDAKLVLLEREGVTLNEENSGADHLIFEGGSFAGRSVYFWRLGFVDDQLHTASVYIQEKENHHIIERYDELVSFYKEKYAAPDTTLRRFEYPYEEGDGFEEQALRLGKAHLTVLWAFPTDTPGVQNSVSIEIDDSLLLKISYQDGALIDKAIQRRKEKAKDDL